MLILGSQRKGGDLPGEARDEPSVRIREVGGSTNLWE